jgi:hypothetical protein
LAVTFDICITSPSRYTFLDILVYPYFYTQSTPDQV